ncbi:MAG: prealbumin-like fold domain-containing protein [Sporichthyaceae bacterium]|nr:prealbumin-like fold domain-containing protein [Sporichthyaceae bacterium]
MGRRRVSLVVLAAGVLVAGLLSPTGAFATHGDVSLSGSNFEIDTDANLKVDHADPPSIDWATVPETRKAELFTGAKDESFREGTKEDTAVPTVVTGSIPPNKSDLLTFGVYLEKNTAGRFLHLFWHRVQEPVGTTNMDFEFNKSAQLSTNGVTPVRVAGDLLIQYDLSQGGSNPTIWVSTWITGSNGETKADCEAANRLPCWSDKTDFTAGGDATGSINTSSIPAGEADGLGAISPRTFGEASLDFDALSGNDPCVGFGSAYLKSRSSDSFTSALKDFIPPTSLGFNDCGAIKITKMRKHAASGAGDHPHAGVTFTVTGGGLPAAGVPAVTDSSGVACVSSLPLGSYTVTETVPAGYLGEAAKTVVVDTAASCADATYVGETVRFDNMPLTDLTVSVSSQVVGGTNSKITCTNLTPTPPDPTPTAFDDLSETVKDLVPGTYTCIVVIDP